MIWKKSWWETRWLFLIGLVAIFLLYGLTVGGGHYDAERWAARLHRSTNLSENERQALNNYQGQTWAIWFKLLLSFIWADFAVVMGAVCLMTACQWTPSRLFTFSLPASRRKILLSQAGAGFGEMFLFALIPSLLLPIIAYCHGQWFSLSSALIYALLMVFGGAVFFCFSFLLAVVLSNWLVAFILAEAVVFALYLPFIGSFGARPWWNVLGVMAGESYFYQRQIPWLGLLISLTLSAVFIFTAIRIYERRDL
jgi:hypothetical protein